MFEEQLGIQIMDAVTKERMIIIWVGAYQGLSLKAMIKK